MINFGLAIDSATVLLRNDIMQCLYLKINMHASVSSSRCAILFTSTRTATFQSRTIIITIQLYTIHMEHIIISVHAHCSYKLTAYTQQSKRCTNTYKMKQYKARDSVYTLRQEGRKTHHTQHQRHTVHNKEITHGTITILREDHKAFR